MKSLSKERVFGLDLLRTIAITLVVISHGTYIMFPNSTHSIVTLIRAFGAIGVDLFFVLSGFLIGGILIKTIIKGKIKFLDLLFFWKRRWLRTIPNYIFVLLINIVLSVIFGYRIPEGIANFFLFLQNLISPHPNFFTEAWSLSVEEYAYIVLPCLIFFGIKFNRNIPKVKMFIYVTIIVILVLWLFKVNYFLTTEVSSYKIWSASFRKVVLYRLDSIYIGFVTVYIINFCKWGSSIKHSKTIAVIGVTLLCLLHVMIYICHIQPQTHLWFYVFVYLNIVICSLAMLFPFFSKFNYSGFGKKTIVFISKTSYSIYLINYSIVLLSLEHFFEFNDLDHIERVGVLLLFFGITIVLSIMLYRYFELPVLKYRNRKYPN